MSPSYCLNCRTELAASQRFCGHCGQKTNTHRITFPYFLHEFFHAFTHTDKGIFHLLKELTLRPGLVAREYIGGKRKKYFNPFTFFLLVMAVFVFSSTLLTRSLPALKPDPAILARITNPEAKAGYIAIMERAGKAVGFMSKYGNVVGMIAVPFLGLISWLCFRRKGYNYGEHLTVNLLFTSYNNLVFALFIIPLQGIFRNPGGHLWLIGCGLAFHAIYLSWGMSGFLLMRGPVKRLKVFLVSLMAITLWMLLSLTVMSVYIYQNRNFYQFVLRTLGLG